MIKASAEPVKQEGPGFKKQKSIRDTAHKHSVATGQGHHWQQASQPFVGTMTPGQQVCIEGLDMNRVATLAATVAYITTGLNIDCNSGLCYDRFTHSLQWWPMLRKLYTLTATVAYVMTGSHTAMVAYVMTDFYHEPNILAFLLF